jgi:hypothetical protein
MSATDPFLGEKDHRHTMDVHYLGTNLTRPFILHY